MDNKNIILIYTKDDILKSEPYSVITHACNTLGFWGAGIAKQMRDEYPIHYKEYNSFVRITKQKKYWEDVYYLTKI
jgi:O-acetyl-ADP-ribose deacetylase (regulator of RNase III)